MSVTAESSSCSRSKINNFAATQNRPKVTWVHGCTDEQQLEAILRLCNTDSAPSRGPAPAPTDNARMAKSADAADLKSAGRKAVGVQVPLWAPVKSSRFSHRSAFVKVVVT